MEPSPPPPAAPRAGTGIYITLPLVTMTTLAYQLLLTRVFSVTLWYHYTFMAISITMFGMTVGALGVYLAPRWFAPAVAARRMSVAALAFGALMMLTFLAHLRMGLAPDIEEESAGRIWLLVVNYAMLSLPFVASGVCVTIALAQFPQQIGKLYAADLAGAALGCLLVAVASRWVDAPTLVLELALVPVFAAVCCRQEMDRRRLWRLGGAALLMVGLLVTVNALNLGSPRPIVRIRWVKGAIEEPLLYERWNAFSRIAVREADQKPIGWGMSARLDYQKPVAQLWLNIDGSAGMVLTQFDGRLEPLEYLRYDVTNLVHYLRPKARVLVVGSGGGRDVLSALYFRQPRVVGVEINDVILETVNGLFGNLTGHLDRVPGVTFVNDEARCYLARTGETFDVIQVSLIDTWAATAAGAYVLTENALYTTEAWQGMMRRLSDRGVLAFNRWYSVDGPAEVYRLTALAVTALQQLGVRNPRDHLIIVCRPRDPQSKQPTGLATLLVSRSPFSAEDLATVDRVAQEMAFDVLLSPRTAADGTFGRLASGENLRTFFRNFPVDISPPTDNRPFFFDMLRLRDVLTFTQPKDKALEPNMAAITTLGALLVTVVALTGLCVLVPLGLTFRRQTLAGALPLLVYFASIGLAFMLVEIALMQRLNLLLGHPIYSMTVVLFCLLAAGGGGSWLSGLIVRDVFRGPAAPACLVALVGVLLAVALAVSPLSARFEGAPTPVRIAVASAVVLLAGLVMGMAFPLGMRAAARHATGLGPWLFGVNGATSICGSVLAMILSLCFGITAALLAGVACYVMALAALAWARYAGLPKGQSAPAH